jgi:hypothetical protein
MITRKEEEGFNFAASHSVRAAQSGAPGRKEGRETNSRFCLKRRRRRRRRLEQWQK